MSFRNTQERYGSLQVALHWTTLVLLIAVYACIELRGFFPKGSDVREALKAWHFTLGLTVLVLTAVRLVARLASPSPRIHPMPQRWQIYAAKLIHIALYALMICMPILGWLILSSDGKPIPFFGLELPPLVNADAHLAEQFKEVHETIGTIGYFLIGIHAIAALVHHYFLRDDTLRRILPRQSRPTGRP